MVEITQIQDIFKTKDFDTMLLVKFHLMLESLEKRLSERFQTAYSEEKTLKEVMLNYTKFQQSVDGAWEGPNKIMRYYYDLKHQMHEVRRRVNTGSVLSEVMYGNTNLSIDNFLPLESATMKRGITFINALEKFNLEYTKMKNMDHDTKIDMLEKHIGAPVSDKIFIQKIDKDEWPRQITISISTLHDINGYPGVKTKTFYLENWEVASSTTDHTKDELVKSKITREKEKGKFFWPEEYL